jgi:hypothetical protein
MNKCVECNAECHPLMFFTCEKHSNPMSLAKASEWVRA